jgi:hypothetical protein
VVAIGVDASDKAVAEAKDPGMDLSSYVSDALHEDARLVLCRAATERVRPRVYVSYISTEGVTAIFSHRLAATLRSLPAE